MNTKPILAFDCSGSGASISLMTEDGVSTRTLAQGQQATELVPTIQTMMQERALKYDALACMVTTVGPGSFTGLRIGLAALHGLVLVHQVPVKILTSLEALAWHVARASNAPKAFTVALTVGKGELAAQEFTVVDGRPVSAGEIMRVAETHTQWVLPCYGNHHAPDAEHYLPCVNTETLCAVSAFLSDSPLEDALPFYIRPADAAIPKPHAWLAT